MAQFVALLRGVGPTNPQMRNEKLCAVFEQIGFTDVRPVLASGNIVFAATGGKNDALAKRIEAALQEKLGLDLDVIVRSERELTALIESDPFKGKEHGKEWYLTVTFVTGTAQPVFSTLKRADMDGPEFMTALERKHGKHITTRTWATLHKIVAKMAAERCHES